MLIKLLIKYDKSEFTNGPSWNGLDFIVCDVPATNVGWNEFASQLHNKIHAFDKYLQPLKGECFVFLLTK